MSLQSLTRHVLATATARPVSARCFGVLTADRASMTMRLNTVSDNAGATHKSKRVGRGPGSKRGKTSTKGHKGLWARSGGKVRAGFEGGQTPLYRRLPKQGPTNAVFTVEYTPLNLRQLQQWIDMGRIDASQPITMKTLLDAGIVGRSIGQGIKLLGTGAERFVAPIHIEVSAASASAISAVEKAGGVLTTKYYSRLALRALLKPEKFDVIPREAKPSPKRIKPFLSWEKRGYLSQEVQLRDLLRAKQGMDAAAATARAVELLHGTPTEPVEARE